MGKRGSPTGWKGAAKRKEDQYWDCRRSLRLRPIKTAGVEDVINYMQTKLKLDTEFTSCMGPLSIQRVPSGPAAKIKDEVIVKFNSIEARDVVKGAARNLAGRGHEYGVRLEIPNSLKGAMGALQAVSYEVRQKFSDARTNVLMEDESMDLVLDFCVGEGRTWRRMTSAQAKTRKRRSGQGQDKFGLDEGEIDEILGGGGNIGGDEHEAGP